MEPRRKRGSETLQTNDRTKGVVGEGVKSVRKAGCYKKSRIRIASPSFPVGGFSNFSGAQARPKTLPPGNRLKEVKRKTPGKIISIRRAGRPIEVNWKRMVYDYIGPKRWVSPRSNGGGSSTFSGISGGKFLVPVPSVAVWPFPSGLDFFKDNSGISRPLEIKGYCFGLPCRRYMGSPPFCNNIGKNPGRSHLAGPGKLWVCPGLGQEQPDAVKRNKVLWTDCKYGQGTGDRATTKAGGDKSLFENIVGNKLGNSQTVGKGYGQGSEFSKGLCPDASKMFGVLLSYRYSKPPKLEMGRKNLSVRAGKNGCALVVGQPGDVQWPPGLETIINKKPVRRCLNNRLVRKIGWTNGIRKLARSAKFSRNRKTGSRSPSAWPSEFRKFVGGFLGSSIYRQPYSTSDNEVRRKTLVAKRSLQKPVASLFGKGHLDLRDEVDSFGAKPGRFLDPGLRLLRLAGQRGGFSTDRGHVWATFNRSNGVTFKYKGAKVQQLSFLPGFRSNKLLYPEVGKRKELCVPPSTFDTESPSPCKKLQSKGYDCNPGMVISRMVAAAPRTKLGGVGPARSKNHICARPVRSCRTLEEPTVEIFGRPYLSIKELSERAKQLAKNAVSPFYKVKAEKYWDLYEKFCKKFGLDMENPLEEGILAFIMWLDVMGLGSQTPRVLQVVVNNLRFEGKGDFRKSLAVTQVLRAIKKEASKNKTPDWPRDPLPIIALRYYVDVPPHRADVSMYKRDIALVALGLRTMRRPGELGSLTLEDIKWDNDGTLWVRICKSKTDQFKNGRFIPVENTGSKYCPVKLLKQYLEIRPKTTMEAPLFLSKQGKKVSVSAVGSIVKRFAEHAGLNGRFTAHSLRIGGATAAMTAGMNLTQIRAIGGWDSKAVMLYLRTVSTAKAGVSRKMGF